MRLIACLLIAVCVWLSYDIYFGRNGYALYSDLSAQLQDAQHKADLYKRRNWAAQDELNELKQGNAAVEELARSELGLIKPDEEFYRVIAH